MVLSPEQAVAVGEVLLDSDIAAARQLSSFAGNQVFELRLRDRLAYLKLARDVHARRNVKREVAVIEHVRARNVPAPTIEAYDESGGVAGVPCVVLGDVGGRPLTGTEAVFCQVGAHLRSLHEIVAIGFGAITAGADLVGDDASWVVALERPAVTLLSAVDAGLVDSGLLTQVRGVIDRFAPVLEDLGRGRLIHGDFHPRHVYAEDSIITGIIDWGDAMAGDPAYDFGRLFHSGVRLGGIDHGRSLVAAALSSYGVPPWLTEPRDAKILFYAAMFMLSSMEGEFLSGAPWPPFWPANAEVLTTILSALDGW